MARPVDEVRTAMAGPSPVHDYFQTKAERYGQASASGPWAWQRRREFAAMAALWGEITGRSALDLGCGAGFYALRLADSGADRVVAVDASPAVIAAIADPRIETVIGDVAAVSLPSLFELVVLAGVLEFVDDPVAVLVNARRHLHPHGRIVAMVPRDNLAGRVYRRFHRRHGVAIALFVRAHFAKLAERAGLAITQSRTVFPFGEVHTMVGQ